MRQSVQASAGAGAYRDPVTRRAVGVAYAVQGLCFAALLTQVPVLQDKFDFSDGALTLLLLAVPVVAGLGSVLAGFFAERFGSAVVLRIAQPLVCLSVLGAGAVGDRPLLYGVLAVFGLSVGAVDATMNMQGVSLERRYGRAILASFYAVWSAAGIVGALSSSANEHWHQALWVGFGVVAVLGIAASAVTGRRLIRRDAERALAVDPTAVPAVPWRPIVLIGIGVALMYVADSATSNWSAEYLRRGLSSPAEFAAWGYAVYQACMVLGRLGADQAARRWGPVTAVRAGVAVGVLGLAVVVAAPDTAVAIVGFGILGFGLSVVVPQSFSAAGQYDPAGTGLAIARVNLFNYVGFLVGAPLVGAAEQLTTWRVGFAVPLVLVAAIIPLATAFRPARRQSASAVPVGE